MVTLDPCSPWPGDHFTGGQTEAESWRTCKPPPPEGLCHSCAPPWGTALAGDRGRPSRAHPPRCTDLSPQRSAGGWGRPQAPLRHRRHSIQKKQPSPRRAVSGSAAGQILATCSDTHKNAVTAALSQALEDNPPHLADGETEARTHWKRLQALRARAGSRETSLASKGPAGALGFH